ncbi:MAG TPA: heparan-alpha-glucosaminide N-acetyltransferase domain-containing protein [Chitinophagaceae bacterium]|nr:heparan-alpha-glucosaminide N-acetyltransferase domain-containing protein [Chitinophagaceae bacterium]
MTAVSPQARPRIVSLDILRGLVMVIMALDHTRDFFFRANISGSTVATGPTDLATTTPLLFFTRWITHFCAPVFLFLAGTSAYLIGLKKGRAALGVFLVKRGIWLIVVEAVLVTFSWTFDPGYHTIIFQVIWAIGMSMVVFGLLVRLPYAWILVLGLVIVCAHNLMDYPSLSQGLKGGLVSDLVYFGNFSVYPIHSGRVLFIVYSFLPWMGLMMLGYCFGRLYDGRLDPSSRRRIILRMGAGLILAFVVLRVINRYGDPVPWSVQPRGAVFSFLSFINVNKYPPSLLYACITLGPALVLLGLLERSARVGLAGRFFRTYGRVPFFYYVLHVYLLHLIVVAVFYLQHFRADQIVTPGSPFLFRPPEFGFGLVGVYLVWISVFLALYPLCRRFDAYKSTHRAWWLSYV